VSENKPFSHLVVVGSSAGGIEALSVLVSTLPADFSAPVVIAQHLDPNRESHLGEILGRRSALPVRQVAGRELLKPGVIYVVPANRHVNITDSEIDSSVGDGRQPKPSVDLLLSSAAEAFEDCLIAVILTGTGSDGAAGAAVVKKQGGTVIIQDPETAEYPGMPLSLAPSTVDIVTELDRMGPVIQGLLAGITPPVEPAEKRALQELMEEVRQRNGIDFSSYKTPTIMRRLRRRIVATESGDVMGYVEYLRRNPEEYQQLVNSFLINVTEFFRDPELFEVLREQVIPRLIEEARERDNHLRLWSAGCATGEEAYSLAILIAEALGDELGRFNVRIFATDIDDGAISFARRGIYAHPTLAGVPENLVNRYFVKEGDDYGINKLVRNMVVFGQHDLAQRAPFPRLDMTICRNVLIYFMAELRKRALRLFAYSLRDGGYLVLGKAESAAPLGEFFVPEDRKLKVYRRRGGRFLMPTGLMESPRPSLRRMDQTPEGRESAEPAAERQQASRGLDGFLLRMPLGVVVVDQSYHIQLINNPARRLLFIHSPATGEDLIHLLRGAAYTTLRSAIDTAFREETSATVEELTIEGPGTGESRYLRMVAFPRKPEGVRPPTKTVILTVLDITDLAQARNTLRETLESVNAELEQEKALNQRLSETNRRFDESNQELIRINEDLRTTNEELLISSEEAQAATEEVETLNEELQATNEELETLNEELQATIEELNTTNDDLQARSVELQELARTSEIEQARLEVILDSIDAAVVVVDAAGQEVFTNAAYHRTFGRENLELYGDDGRVLPPEARPQQRAGRGEEFRTRFTATDRQGVRRRFEATGRAVYYDEEDRHGGVVLIREVPEDEA
jgi:two-component system, chemotaxis family, CheB/CheR fusion protein